MHASTITRPHRDDIAAVDQAELDALLELLTTLSPDDDRVIVAQVVRDLARDWSGPPLTLELTSDAGGRWSIGHGEPVTTAVWTHSTTCGCCPAGAARRRSKAPTAH